MFHLAFTLGGWHQFPPSLADLQLGVGLAANTNLEPVCPLNSVIEPSKTRHFSNQKQGSFRVAGIYIYTVLYICVYIYMVYLLAPTYIPAVFFELLSTPLKINGWFTQKLMFRIQGCMTTELFCLKIPSLKITASSPLKMGLTLEKQISIDETSVF